MDNHGASAEPTGLPMNGAQEVSAVPVGIPSAWEPVEYEDGYPVDEDFAALGAEPVDFYRAAHWLLAELPRAAENMTCFCEVTRVTTDWTEEPCSKIEFSTGGWSGAESLIGLLERRFDMSYFMESWRRGGHFVFEVPDHFLVHESMEAAQAIEARQGGNGEAGAVHESAVGNADAPERPDQ